MTRADTWMPLYVGDYLRDTGHLSAAENGAYLMLLMQAWTRDGQLPGDDDLLRRMARMDQKEWKRSGKIVMAFFQANEIGFRHKRIDHELGKTDKFVGQRSAAGKASAEARARKRKPDENGNGGGNENPTAVDPAVGVSVPTGVQRNARPSQSQSQKEDTSSLRSDAAAAASADPPIDARTELFRDGKAILGRLTGKPPDGCGALISRWLRELRDDCLVLMAVLRDAERQRPAGPVAWISAAVKARGGPDLADPWGIRGWIARQSDVQPGHLDGVKVACVGGYGVEATAAIVAEAAGLAPTSRINWDAMGAWMREGVELLEPVLQAITRQANRMHEQGEAVRSIAVFDAAVRAAAARHAA